MTAAPDPISNANQEQRTSALDRRDVVILVLAAFALVLMRLHAFAAALEIDECNYAYIGEQLLKGARMYVDVWDHHPPGMFAWCAFLIAVFGNSPVVFRIAATGAALLTMTLLFSISRRHLGALPAWLTALLFAIVSSDPGTAGEGCNREIYMNLLAVTAVWLAASDRRGNDVLSGLALGLASLLKPIAAVIWLGIAVVTITLQIRERRSARTVLACVGRLTIAPLLLWMLTLVWFWATERAQLFIDATFAFNIGYAELDGLGGQRLIRFFTDEQGFRTTVFRSAAGVWICGLVGLCLLPYRVRPVFSAHVLAYTLTGAITVILPGRFWHHYYMLLIPPLMLCCGAIAYRLQVRLLPHALVYAAFLLAVTFALQCAYYLCVAPERVAYHRYGQRMSWAREQGRLIAENTEPDDTIYVAGMDVGIYYYSQRKCATRYTIPKFAGNTDAARQRRKRLLHDLRRHRPRLIILVVGTPKIPELDTYIREVGYVAIAEDPGRAVILCDPQRPVALDRVRAAP